MTYELYTSKQKICPHALLIGTHALLLCTATKVNSRQYTFKLFKLSCDAVGNLIDLKDHKSYVWLHLPVNSFDLDSEGGCIYYDGHHGGVVIRIRMLLFLSIFPTSVRPNTK